MYRVWATHVAALLLILALHVSQNNVTPCADYLGYPFPKMQLLMQR